MRIYIKSNDPRAKPTYRLGTFRHYWTRYDRTLMASFSHKHHPINIPYATIASETRGRLPTPPPHAYPNE